jgi:thioredoxin reductase
VVAVADSPPDPGDYDVVVVGSGPGGLQVGHSLDRLGVRYAVISADDMPGGMFRRWPIFDRLLSWSQLETPFTRESREYEKYDHNSLVAEEPGLRATVPAEMSGESVLPSRAEMHAGLAAFADRARVRVRYGCSWTGTRREGAQLILETTDGAFTCRAAVFALGVTVPWRPPIPGIADVPHYADVVDERTFSGKRVVVIGKRNAAFELATRLLPRAQSIVLVSPRRVRADLLARASVRAPYFQPLEQDAHGMGARTLDTVVERIARTAEAQFVVHTGQGPIHADSVVACTGFGTPLMDLGAFGVETVARGRIPALTPYWESVGAPGIYFAGNASQGAAGLRRHGSASLSSAVLGFRYNARVLAGHLAERVTGHRPRGRPLQGAALVETLAHELAHGPELWTQKGYLARAVSLTQDGGFDDGVVPLEYFVDSSGPDAAAVTIEADAAGVVHPVVYLRRGGTIRDVPLDPDPLAAYARGRYRKELGTLLSVG